MSNILLGSLAKTMLKPKAMPTYQAWFGKIQDKNIDIKKGKMLR